MDRPPQLDADAWVDRYGDALFHFARGRVQDGSVAEDLVQETFLAAVQSKERFKGNSSEKTWLFGILKHKIVDHYRRRKKIVNIRDGIEHSEHVETFFNTRGGWQTRPGHWSVNPEKAHANKVFLDHFFQCLSGLPQRTAEVFVQREMDGLSTGEICNRLSITKNHCWVLLYRARVLLRQCLERVGFNQQPQGSKS